MNGSVDGNGEAAASEQETLLFPKILNAITLFQKGCDALKYDDLVVAVDLRFHYRFEDTKKLHILVLGWDLFDLALI